MLALVPSGVRWTPIVLRGPTRKGSVFQHPRASENSTLRAEPSAIDWSRLREKHLHTDIRNHFRSRIMPSHDPRTLVRTSLKSEFRVGK